MNIIETHGLTRRFGRTAAVCDLTLAVPAGSLFALLGPNGAGKTTTIKLLLDLLVPDAGEACVLGVPSRRLGPAQWRQIGYVSENQQLPRDLTVAQLLDYCRPLYPTWDRALEQSLLTQFDLPPDRRLRHLSRGMFMKAALLTALAFRPRMLVLDEPFTGLDPLVRDEFINGVVEVAAQGEWSVFVSSHDIAEVERLCDWVALLDGGRLQLAEPVEQLQARVRRVEVDLQDGPARLENPPETWLGLERAGGFVGFIDTRYDRAGTERACRERFPTGAVRTLPLTLHEIVVALMRAQRVHRKGATA